MLKRKTKQQRIDELEALVAEFRQSAGLFEVRLNEARRRTIPMHGYGDVNFLPAFVEKVDVHHDVKQLQSCFGKSAMVVGKATVTIVCQGDVVMPANKPAEKAKPAPELGWKILNTYADRIEDRTEANIFVADSRMLEQGFTTGEISESMYRMMLQALMPKAR